MKNCPISYECAQLGSKFCPIQNKPSNNSQRLLKFCQSGENSPNLVTVDSEVPPSGGSGINGDVN